MPEAPAAAAGRVVPMSTQARASGARHRRVGVGAGVDCCIVPRFGHRGCGFDPARGPVRFGDPADLWSPVALRPRLATGLPVRRRPHGAQGPGVRLRARRAPGQGGPVCEAPVDGAPGRVTRHGIAQGRRFSTSARSASSSSVVTRIRSVANSSWVRPSTTVQPPWPLARTGNPNWIPWGTPYSPLDTTANEVQSSPRVPLWMAATESMAALAAEAADDSPRASITAAPRFCTVEMKSPCSQAASSMTSVAGLPSMRALAKSGNWVAEWLPQMARLLTEATGTPALWASWLLARFSSSRVMANHRSAGTSGAFDRAIRQLVLHGFPTTRTRTSVAALAAMAWPWGPKIPPLTVSRSPRSMPALRGIEPTSSAQLGAAGRLD